VEKLCEREKLKKRIASRPGALDTKARKPMADPYLEVKPDRGNLLLEVAQTSSRAKKPLVFWGKKR